MTPPFARVARHPRIAALAVASVLFATLAVVAPRSAPAQGAGAGLAPPNIISLNPLGLLLPFFSVEYEAAVTDNSSFAVTGSYYDEANDDADDFRHWSLEGKYRLFPGERAPEGLFVGLTGGISMIHDADEGCNLTCPEERNATAFTTGLEGGYTWMFGARRTIALGVGVGAKRLYFLGDRPEGVSRVEPTLRLTIGRAF